MKRLTKKIKVYTQSFEGDGRYGHRSHWDYMGEIYAELTAHTFPKSGQESIQQIGGGFKVVVEKNGLWPEEKLFTIHGIVWQGRRYEVAQSLQSVKNNNRRLYFLVRYVENDSPEAIEEREAE